MFTIVSAICLIDGRLLRAGSSGRLPRAAAPFGEQVLPSGGQGACGSTSAEEPGARGQSPPGRAPAGAPAWGAEAPRGKAPARARACLPAARRGAGRRRVGAQRCRAPVDGRRRQGGLASPLLRSHTRRRPGQGKGVSRCRHPAAHARVLRHGSERLETSLRVGEHLGGRAPCVTVGAGRGACPGPAGRRGACAPSLRPRLASSPKGCWHRGSCCVRPGRPPPTHAAPFLPLALTWVRVFAASVNSHTQPCARHVIPCL